MKVRSLTDDEQTLVAATAEDWCHQLDLINEEKDQIKRENLIEELARFFFVLAKDFS